MTRNTKLKPINILSVNIAKMPNTPKHSVAKVNLIKIGIVGDGTAGNHGKQINVLTEESIEKISRLQKKPFHYGDLGENITVQGLDTNEINLFDQIHIENQDSHIILEISALNEIFLNKYENIPKQDLGFCCRVIEGGTLRADEKACLLTRKLKIKLLNLYTQDLKRSLIEENNALINTSIEKFGFEQKWNHEISNETLLIKPEKIKEFLIKDIDNYDIVLISGGIGIGNKDLVPETITGLDLKIIPGIMEIIRPKNFLHNPSSITQRSIAAIKNRTIIFCIPGDFDSVQIYMEEIKGILNDLIFQIKTLDF